MAFAPGDRPLLRAPITHPSVKKKKVSTPPDLFTNMPAQPVHSHSIPHQQIYTLLDLLDSTYNSQTTT